MCGCTAATADQAIRPTRERSRRASPAATTANRTTPAGWPSRIPAGSTDSTTSVPMNAAESAGRERRNSAAAHAAQARLSAVHSTIAAPNGSSAKSAKGRMTIGGSGTGTTMFCEPGQ